MHYSLVCEYFVSFKHLSKIRFVLEMCPSFTVVWNDHLLIFWPKCYILLHKKFETQCNNKICCNIKVPTHPKTLSHFCWFFFSFQNRWLILEIFTKFKFLTKWGRYSSFKLLIIQWKSIMLFDLSWNVTFGIRAFSCNVIRCWWWIALCKNGHSVLSVHFTYPGSRSGFAFVQQSIRLFSWYCLYQEQQRRNHENWK